jgi:competence protein ComEC
VRMKYGTILKTILIILMIWFYAMLTGLTPAVMRASVMITLVVIGRAMKRQPDILNILAASFIFLVIHESTLLLDVGFQLSYLAVAGIVVIYKPVYDLYVTSSHIPDKIWSIIAVSIVAQIATFPLSLHYFHQFPNYFMITNIIVVPLSSLVIYNGILLLFFGSVPGISLWLAKLLSALVWGLNNSIHFIGKIPFALSKGIYISAIQTLLLYLLILFVFLFLFMKRKVFFFLSLALLAILISTILLRKVETMTTGKIIVYGTKDLSAIELVMGNHAVFLYSPGVLKNISFLENRKATHDALGIVNEIRFMQRNTDEAGSRFSCRDWFYKKGEFIQLGDIRMAIHCRGFAKPVKYVISLDYLILTGNPDISIGQLLKVFKAREIIADPTNRGWRVKKWKEEAKQCGVGFYSVSEKGLFYRVF